jgi:fatty-acyl-CoA synthase
MKVPLSPLAYAGRARRLYPDRLAVVDGDLRLTYREFMDRCDRWSSVLQRLGVKPGDRVATIAPNTHAQLEAFYAIPQIGAVAVPVNYRLTAADFAYIVQHSGARVLCVHSDYIDAVDGIRGDLPGVEHFVAFEGAREGWLDYESELAAAPAAFSPADIDEDDLVSINYTSGTTAKPKGVMITHRNAALNVLNTLVHFPMSPADAYLWTLPMFHANGWTFVWNVTARGATHVCLRKVDPVTIFQLIGREKVTTLCAAPTVLIGIANAPEESRAPARGQVVRLLTAGAPPAAVTIERVEKGLGWQVTHVYGLTETSPLILVSEEWPEHSGLDRGDLSTVKARQGVELVASGEIRVVGDGGVDVPHDGKSLGEIIVRGNVVMAGYFNDPEATERAIVDGWFHTGDAAVVHPDGFVEIRDRFKDVIISGGENISSVEVEGVLLRHEAVQEVSVVGMPHPKWGEAPHAFVVLRPGASVTEAELKQYARDNMAHFKAPQWFSFLSELPKTATGKIQKYILRGGSSSIARQ